MLVAWLRLAYAAVFLVAIGHLLDVPRDGLGASAGRRSGISLGWSRRDFTWPKMMNGRRSPVHREDGGLHDVPEVFPLLGAAVVVGQDDQMGGPKTERRTPVVGTQTDGEPVHA